MSTNAPAVMKQGQLKNLALATWIFAITFWAWNMIAPLGVLYTESFGLSSGQKALLVAAPVLVGSLGRIVTGALTDRFGGRRMFTVLSFASIVPVLLVSYAGQQDSYTLLLICAFLLGIAGTTFAVGIPFVNAWFEASRRGFATGVFGAGMGGTALSAFFTPRFVNWFGYTQTYLIVAAALAITGAVTWMVVKDSPAWQPSAGNVVPKLAKALKLPVTWQMSFLYAVTFGGFVAFSTYLPTYLKDVYDFDLTAAGTRAAGFALGAVVARPIGGVLSDRFGPRPIVLLSLAGTAVLAVVIATQPIPELPAGSSFVAMAVMLGVGTGGVFAWVVKRAPADRVGSVAGIVGAAGGLGGFFPPLVMGATYDEAAHSYTVGLALLCLTAVVALVFVLTAVRDKKSPQQQPAPTG